MNRKFKYSQPGAAGPLPVVTTEVEAVLVKPGPDSSTLPRRARNDDNGADTNFAGALTRFSTVITPPRRRGLL